MRPARQTTGFLAAGGADSPVRDLGGAQFIARNILQEGTLRFHSAGGMKVRRGWAALHTLWLPAYGRAMRVDPDPLAPTSSIALSARRGLRPRDRARRSRGLSTGQSPMGLAPCPAPVRQPFRPSALAGLRLCASPWGEQVGQTRLPGLASAGILRRQKAVQVESRAAAV